MKPYGLLMVACMLMPLVGCSGTKSARGFSLPDGDPTRGQDAFVELQCHACHTVSGVELPELDPKPEKLIDLVAFLEAHYQLEPYDPTEYPPLVP